MVRSHGRSNLLFLQTLLTNLLKCAAPVIRDILSDSITGGSYEFCKSSKNTLLQDIDDMAKVSWIFSKHSETDFIRKRKIDFQSLLHFSICMEAGTLRYELLKYFSYDPSTLSNAAFYLQRRKLLPETFPFFFQQLNSHSLLLYTRENTAFLPAMDLHLLLPEILMIRNLISLRMGKPQMLIIEFI